VPNSVYDADLAWIHQQGYEPALLKDVSRLHAILRAHGVRKGRVIDLACGAGGWAAFLSRRGYDVLGIDLSPSMVALARRRAPNAAFVRASMTAARLPGCDAVTAFGEAINYLLGPGAVRRLFLRISSALRPGGIFLFDLLEPLRTNTLRRTAVRVERDWALTASIVEEARSIVRRITWFRKTGRRYRRGFAVHRQTRHAPSDVAKWLRSAGLLVRSSRLDPRHALVIARKPALSPIRPPSVGRSRG
jgi:SAM-dependent methyltransferase